MPEYYEYEEYVRRPSRHREEPEEYFSGPAAHPYDPDYRPFNSSPRPESAHRKSAGRLEAPDADARPRSVPPPNTAVVRRARSPSPLSSHSGDDRDRSLHRGGRDRSPSPVTKARNAMQDNFTNSTAGIGAGLLGAVVGGLVARQASEAAMKHRNNKKGRRTSYSRDDENDSTARIVSTFLGAVAGGLGANALANRVEDSRERGRARQEAWEKRHGREEDLPHYDTGNRADLNHRNGRGLIEDDDDYDFVYDARDDDRMPRRRRSEEDYRRRW
ncbi:hypothetical protein B0I35DRAFT_71787 [Stachybotrys elegans]|uniref:Glycine zipper 2TM domain-containing protein n=1 Tax=Stachybotrys elegans TaxID=80388 RepID=A0A8K0WNU0_9HYPO|nr:hypothetical protein B0I35DRAFT_71787 [Stachybotrys elegans]